MLKPTSDDSDIMLIKRTRPTIGFLFLILSMCCFISDHSSGQEALYKQYVDPAGRFSFEYPATMKLEAAQKDEVTVYHPATLFRISVFVERRQGKSNLTADILLAVWKKALQEEMKNVSGLGEGKLANLQGSQGMSRFLLPTKKDANGPNGPVRCFRRSFPPDDHLRSSGRIQES